MKSPSFPRGLGLPESCPFVLSEPVIEELRFIHETVSGRGVAADIRVPLESQLPVRGCYNCPRRTPISRIIVKSKVGSDGILQFTLPLGPGEANQEVRGTIESSAAPLSQEEWKRRILATAGAFPIPRSFGTIRATKEEGG